MRPGAVICGNGVRGKRGLCGLYDGRAVFVAAATRVAVERLRVAVGVPDTGIAPRVSLMARDAKPAALMKGNWS